MKLITRPNGADNYHLYRDTTAFRYEVTLSRPDRVYNRNERWILRVSTKPLLSSVQHLFSPAPALSSAKEEGNLLIRFLLR